jgi:hypothetical protein
VKERKEGRKRRKDRKNWSDDIGVLFIEIAHERVK